MSIAPFWKSTSAAAVSDSGCWHRIGRLQRSCGDLALRFASPGSGYRPGCFTNFLQAYDRHLTTQATIMGIIEESLTSGQCFHASLFEKEY